MTFKRRKRLSFLAVPSLIMRLCACCAAVLAVLISGFLSGAFSRLGLIHFFVEYVLCEPAFYGMSPATVDLARGHWDYGSIRPGELKGKIALVTGGNSGLGYATAQQLALKGAITVLGCRNSKKCNLASEKINKELILAKSDGKAIPMPVDVADFESVREFSRLFKRRFSNLHIFVQNAGIVSGPEIKYTKDGIERTFHTNHFGHFQMTNCLKNLIESAMLSSSVRIVTISSTAHFSLPADFKIWGSLEEINDPVNFRKYFYYSVTKFANILFSNGIANGMLFNDTSNLIATSAHPGVVETGIWEADVSREILESFGLPDWIGEDVILPVVRQIRNQTLWTNHEGARTQTYLATQANRTETGKYYHPIARQVNAHPMTNDLDNIRAFWELSSSITAGKC